MLNQYKNQKKNCQNNIIYLNILFFYNSNIIIEIVFYTTIKFYFL